MLQAEVPATDLGLIAELTRIAVAAPDAAAFRELSAGQIDDVLVEIMALGYRDASPYDRWPAVDRPGVYRREHASLIFRSEETTLVTDPQALMNAWTTGMGRYPTDPSTARGGSVLITHHHGDHFHQPSIMGWIDEHDRAVMPAVPQASLMAEDMPAIGRAAFGTVDAPDWWSSISIGDIVVDVLPFYGEQPPRRLPAASPELQNWGNCYRFNMPGGFSVALLADSGADALGHVHDVLRRSVAERGPIDVLIRCCFHFPEAINPGLALLSRKTCPRDHAVI